VRFPPGPTWTLVFRSPPIGSPFGGDVLVDAVFAAALKASIVLPDVGLKALSVGLKARKESIDARINRMDHSTLAMISSRLATVNPNRFCVVHCNRPCCRRSGSEVCCGDEAREKSASERMAWILERGLSDRVILLRLIEAPIDLG
jgi:hypothetical protein